MAKYDGIRAWGRLMGRLPSTTEEQVELAERERAPKTAIFRNTDGVWRTEEDIVAEHTRAMYERELVKVQEGIKK